MMDIVCSIDDNYVQHCCVMLTSFLRNNRNVGHRIHLLTEGITSKNQEQIRCLVESYKGEFYYYLVDSKILATCPIKDSDHLTIATYYRLLMADILPKKIDKILYLDCDIIINGSILEFWNTLLDGYALAAVEELGCSFPDVYKRLNYDEKYGYFNAGVILVNLAYWRACDMTKRFFDYMLSNSDKLISHDQDVLNALLHDKCIHVSCQWNVEEAFYHYSVLKRLNFDKEMRYILRHPKILHYTWKPKPWEPKCKHPFRINYFIYLKKLGVSSLTVKQKILAFADKYMFWLLVWVNVKGHKFYKL